MRDLPPPCRARERHQVFIHVDAATLATEGNGAPLSVGRRTRAIPPAIRRALVARDGRCQFPGCERRRFVDAHHIHHWARGGDTGLDNLVLLCRHHHRAVHEGGVSIERPESSRPSHRFIRADGAEIPASPVPPVPARGRPPSLPKAPGRLLTGTGEPMDLRSCVDAVLAAGTAPRD